MTVLGGGSECFEAMFLFLEKDLSRGQNKWWLLTASTGGM